MVEELHGRTQGNRHKLKKERIRPDIRNKFFTVRTAKYWSRLFRGAMLSLSLEVFKNQLDKDLSSPGLTSYLTQL